MKSQYITLSNIPIQLSLLLSLSIFSCAHHSTNHNDTLKQATTDTIPKAKPKSELQQEKDDGAPSLSSILNDQLKSYRDTIRIDTTFYINGHDTMHISLRHYCTYDNKINLPARYLKIHNLTEFKTHSFISALKVKINSKVIFKGFIKKEDFEKLLDDELKKYAVLIGPNVELSNNGLSIQYSISVPLSDVGKGVTIKIDTSGNKYITAD